jgi:hypothetical protein
MITDLDIAYVYRCDMRAPKPIDGHCYFRGTRCSSGEYVSAKRHVLRLKDKSDEQVKMVAKLCQS